jgi:hypothetical protein
VDVAAEEAEVLVAHQRPRQQPHLGQDLEAVADAEHEAALLGMAADRLHDRGELRQRAGAQVIAVREAAGDDHDIGAFEVGVLVPQHLGVRAEDVLRHVQCIVIAVRAGEDDDAEFHEGSLSRVLSGPPGSQPGAVVASTAGLRARRSRKRGVNANGLQLSISRRSFPPSP